MRTAILIGAFLIAFSINKEAVSSLSHIGLFLFSCSLFIFDAIELYNKMNKK